MKKKKKKNDLKENFHRNRVLIDFNYIPRTINKRIMNAYKNYSFPPPENIYKYFKKYNMREFLENYTHIENLLMELY